MAFARCLQFDGGGETAPDSLRLPRLAQAYEIAFLNRWCGRHRQPTRLRHRLAYAVLQKLPIRRL